VAGTHERINKDELVKLFHVLAQPTRQKIIKALREAGPGSLYIDEIAQKIKEDRRNVSFHLATLAEYGLVDGDYKVIEQPVAKSKAKGKAAKFYHLTDKFGEAVSSLVEELTRF